MMKLIHRLQAYTQQRMLSILLLLSIVPVIGFGMIIYVIGTDIVRTEANKSSTAALTQVKEQIDLLVDQIEQVTGQFTLQAIVKEISNIGEKPALGSILPINQMRLELSNFLSSLKAIDSVYYYHVEQEVVVTSSVVTDLELLRDNNWEPLLHEAAEKHQQSFWIIPRLVGSSSGGASRNGISYVKLLPLLYTDMKAALIVNLDTSYLSTPMNKFPYTTNGGLMIFSPQGELVMQGGGLPRFSTAETSSLIEQYRLASFHSSTPENVHSSVLEWTFSGVRYYTNFETSTRNGWIYASLIPTQEMYSKVDQLKKNIIWCTVSLALLAWLMSMLSFTQIQRGLQRIVRLLFKQDRQSDSSLSSSYGVNFQNKMLHIEKGVANLLEEVHEVRGQWRDHLPLLKDHYLLSALVDHSSIVDQLLKRHSQEIGLFQHPRFVVFIMEMDQPGAGARFPLSNEKLFLFAVANITSELMRAIYTTEIVTTHKCVVAVLNIPEHAAEADLMHALETIRVTVNHVLKQPVTISVGRVVGSFEDISVSYHEALQLLHHNWIRAGNEIITLQQSNGLMLKFDYPLAVEEKIVEAIRTGEKEIALREMEAFGNALAGQNVSFHFMKTYYLQLLVSIVRLVQQYEEDIHYLFGARGPFHEFLVLDGQKAVQAWFNHTAIGSTISFLSTLKQHRKQELAAAALEIIRLHYNKDLSLQLVADQLNISVSYISILFKETIGENFIDYVTRYRIDKAKVLLLETDINIGQIAVEIGYNNAQQLIRAFKRVEGTTPGDYRSANNTFNP
ncbi:helix-turn-helix domain-containing protein [Paenibacillus koleovorans]|uniref:helix-turn-helix domain-containing protein n=1 Tax=Paenibacillus koleovorans TaxID=121608 RepID=UPI000FDC9BD7|nr:helix-turn-helix domain-containing protein [Paenibacillus koleovorans]